ncbi:MAG: ATP-binding cassette domain-containing protein [Microbacteriaceae bacterium]|nr:ATP-binding cassette domain-containing protein [Microbacteriaceae bacterium]
MAYGATTVIDRLDFEVVRGETFGLLGSNGSGKTTTLRALLGLIVPTAGELTIGGEPYRPGRVRVGYLPEERGLYKREPVLEVMTYFGRLKGMTAGDADRWSRSWLERMGLADKARLALGKLSGGQQQKVQLGVTIMDDPELLILDEPTKGFDPVNQRLLMDIIAEQQRRGTTLVLVSHDMAQVERLADRVLLLKDGVARAYGSVADVRGEFGGKSLNEVFLEVYGTVGLEEDAA